MFDLIETRRPSTQNKLGLINTSLETVEAELYTPLKWTDVVIKREQKNIG